jgi:hypothetical protein
VLDPVLVLLGAPFEDDGHLLSLGTGVGECWRGGRGCWGPAVQRVGRDRQGR